MGEAAVAHEAAMRWWLLVVFPMRVVVCRVASASGCASVLVGADFEVAGGRGQPERMGNVATCEFAFDPGPSADGRRRVPGRRRPLPAAQGPGQAAGVCRPPYLPPGP